VTCVAKVKTKNEKIGDFLAQLAAKGTLRATNRFLEKKLNIQQFFSSVEEVKLFLDYCKQPQQVVDKRVLRSWGDIQTPPALVKAIYHRLKKEGFYPQIIVEPTFGDGNFLLPIFEFYPKAELVYGIEIQPCHRWNALLQLSSYLYSKPKPKVAFHLIEDNIFSHSFKKELFSLKGKKILLIGNPPWITTAELSKLEGTMHPVKSNFKKATGITAITGKSNFDVTEAIIHHLLNQFSGFTGKIAFLCKNSVIRNIMKFLPKASYGLSNIQALTIDTKAIFGRAAQASLFLATLSPVKRELQCTVALFKEQQPSFQRTIGWVDNHFVSNVEKYVKVHKFEGISPLQWRQGVKHDCSKILELVFDPKMKMYENKLGEQASLEREYIFPLLKGSDLKAFEVHSSEKFLLVTQKTLADKAIQTKCPKTWHYLNNHKSHFEKRKSRVYRGKGDFAIFGIGNYSFKKYKVAKAGLSKHFLFSLVPPISNKPVLFDDTCYFLGFDSYAEALLICTILNSAITREFLEAIVELDSKRPFTKEILMRLNLRELVTVVPLKEFPEIWREKNFNFTGSMKTLESIRQQIFA